MICLEGILVGLRCSSSKNTSRRAICCKQGPHCRRYGFFLRPLHVQCSNHFPGFYGVTYYIGFRDDFDVRVSIIFLFHFDCGPEILFRPRIWLKKSVSQKDSWILKFRKRFLKKSNRSPKRLHICECFDCLPWNYFSFDFLPSTPHYHVVSKRIDVGYISPFINYLRAFLIEGLFRRLGKSFFKLIRLFLFCAE